MISQDFLCGCLSHLVSNNSSLSRKENMVAKRICINHLFPQRWCVRFIPPTSMVSKQVGYACMHMHGWTNLLHHGILYQLINFRRWTRFPRGEHRVSNRGGELRNLRRTAAKWGRIGTHHKDTKKSRSLPYGQRTLREGTSWLVLIRIKYLDIATSNDSRAIGVYKSSILYGIHLI